MDAVAKLEHPSKQTKRRFYLSLCSVFKRFMSYFALLAAPLDINLKRDEYKQLEPLDETESVTAASLNQAFINLPVLSPSGRRGKRTLNADACENEIGCSFGSRKTEKTTLLATGTVPRTTRSRNWPQRKESACWLYDL